MIDVFYGEEDRKNVPQSCEKRAQNKYIPKREGYSDTYMINIIYIIYIYILYVTVLKQQIA